MKSSRNKIGKVVTSFGLIGLILLVIIVVNSFRDMPQQVVAGQVDPDATLTPVVHGFDENSGELFQTYDNASKAFMSAGSSERTLDEYYSRRLYSGSPPPVPHESPEVYGKALDCLSCHAKGGWSEQFKRHAPVTPHPEQLSCRQCHVRKQTQNLFTAANWKSLPPPRLGGAFLPGGPPPIPHSLQMRGNCFTCHVGPGAVTNLRVEHASRGNCRQCHVPLTVSEPFARN